MYLPLSIILKDCPLSRKHLNIGLGALIILTSTIAEGGIPKVSGPKALKAPGDS